MALLALAYYFASELGLVFASTHGSVTPVWPASGIAMSALLLWGPRLALGVLIGALAVNLETCKSVFAALAMTAGNVLEPLLGVWLVRRFTSLGRGFERISDTLGFTVLATVLGPIFSATLGVGALVVSGQLEVSGWSGNWLTWWLGNAMGILIVTPLVIEWQQPARGRWTPARAVEVVVLAGLSTWVSIYVLARPPVAGWYQPQVVYLFPLITWAAVRFGSRGATGATLLVATVAMYGAATGKGPFAQSNWHGLHLPLQMFLILAAATALLLAAAAREKDGIIEALSASENRSKAFFEYAPDAIFLFPAEGDDVGRIIAANPAAARMHGYPVDQLVGMTIRELDAPVDAAVFHARVRKILESGRIKFEVEHIDHAGRHIPFEVHAGVVEIGGRKHVLAFDRDISDRRQLEEQKRTMADRIQQAQKLESLGVLAGGIAHDFNNLLTGILGNANLARLELPPDSPVLANIAQIENASQRAAELCRQMLAYAGRGRFVIQRLDLSTLVAETTELLQLSISKKARLSFALQQGLPPVAADVTQIRQIVMNLVMNASDAIGDRDGTIKVSTGVLHADQRFLAETYLAPELPAGDYVFLEIADDGCGMDAETVSRIFEPFFTTKFAGRGLGLAAVLGIVRSHHGALQVRSEVGAGSTFRLLLPAADGIAEAMAANPTSDADWRGRGRVLVIDDEESVRGVAARMLRALGFEPVGAAGGDEGVRLFAQTTGGFVLVLLDLTMPGVGGDATFHALRRVDPGVKVVLMSGFPEQDAVQRFLGQGLAGFLQKPFSAAELRAKLRAALA